VYDVDSITDDAKRAEVLEMNLRVGAGLIRAHQGISSFDEIEGIVREVIET
jgi:5-methylthioribose kinase